MADEILNSLLKEYSQKKLQAELDLEKRKEELYNSIPRLRQIEDDLNNFAISTAKNILKNGSSPEEEQELKNKVELLKAEKARILAELNLPDIIYNHFIVALFVKILDMFQMAVIIWLCVVV